MTRYRKLSNVVYTCLLSRRYRALRRCVARTWWPRPPCVWRPPAYPPMPEKSKESQEVPLKTNI